LGTPKTLDTGWNKSKAGKKNAASELSAWGNSARKDPKGD